MINFAKAAHVYVFGFSVPCTVKRYVNRTFMISVRQFRNGEDTVR